MKTPIDSLRYVRRMLWAGVLSLALAFAATTLSAQSLQITLNMPSYKLVVFSDSTIVRTYPVAIGMRKYPTPRGRFHVRSIEWNPWWIPPDAPWARDKKITPPGPDNPMGAVKMTFKPLYFMHGTPDTASRGSAASHGCVRMSSTDALDLAALILSTTHDDSARARILASAEVGRTILVSLVKGVPIEIRYDLVELSGDTILLHPNPYHVNTTPRRAVVDRLVAAGIDTSRVDFRRLAVPSRFPRTTRPFPLVYHTVDTARVSPLSALLPYVATTRAPRTAPP